MIRVPATRVLAGLFLAAALIAVAGRAAQAQYRPLPGGQLLGVEQPRRRALQRRVRGELVDAEPQTS